MAVFVDDLAYNLFVVSFAGLLMLYTASKIYLTYRKRGKNFSEILKGAVVPLGILGAYMLINGIVSQLLWPLPGSYNILFFDPFVAFGSLLVALAIMVKYDLKLEYIGFLGLMIGAMAIAYGWYGYSIGLTKSPIDLFGIYFFFGVAGVLSYPVSLIIDRLQGGPGPQKNIGTVWIVVFILFLLALLVASGLAGYTGFAALPAHLLSAP